jgi:hypothetical protein
MCRHFKLAPLFQTTTLFNFVHSGSLLPGRARNFAGLQISGCKCCLEELGGETLTLSAGHSKHPPNRCR